MANAINLVEVTLPRLAARGAAHRRRLQRLRQGSALEAAEAAPGGFLRRVRGHGPGAGREEGGRGDR